MEFIDLLKVGANKKEAAIAYNKISEPTIDYDGINANAILVLLMICMEMFESGSDVDADIFGDYNDGMFMLGKSAFVSTFGDVFHEGTYNFFTDTASIDEEILSNSMLSAFGKGGVNLTARVVRHPLLEMFMGSQMGSLLGEESNISIYSIIPDDIYINIMLKELFVQYLSGDSSSSGSSLELLALLAMLPPIGIPFIIMSSDALNSQFGEESVVMYGMGLYSMLGSMSI